ARGAEQHWMERLNSAYGRALNWSFDHRALTVASAAVILIAALGSLFFIGTEFMPRLDEGSILVETRKLPAVSLTDSVESSMRIDETISGVKADLAIKVFGDDFSTLDALGQQVLRSISTVRGAAEAQMEVTSGVAQLSVDVDRAALARYGLNVTDVQETVAAGGSGDLVSEVIDGQKRYTVALRVPDRYRTDPDAVRGILLRAPGGEQVALDQLARIQVTRGPEKIEREQGQR